MMIMTTLEAMAAVFEDACASDMDGITVAMVAVVTIEDAFVAAVVDTVVAVENIV